jgi:hypothetical protein
MLATLLHWLWYGFGLLCLVGGLTGLWWLAQGKLTNSEE